MKRIYIFLILLNFICFSASSQSLDDELEYQQLRSELAEYIDHHLYIQIKENLTLGSKLIKDHSSSYLYNFSELALLMENGKLISIEQEFKVLAKRNDDIARVYRLEFEGLVDLDKMIIKLSKLDNIKLAEKIPLYKTSLVPNDPDYGDPTKNWHLDAIGAEAAWDITTGCDTITIAIVDDAVLTAHEDLITKIYTNPGEIPSNGIDDDGNGYIDDVYGWDVADNDNNANPPSSATNSFFTHGTHVAGIAGGASDNSIGTASIGFNSMIVAIKTKSDANSSPSTLNNPMAGVEYAIVLGVDVINMSWGSYAPSSVNQMVFSQAYSDGIVCVAAAGNHGGPILAYPADYPNVISVGATNQTNDMATFSNFRDIDIWAPGTDIWSSLAGSNSSYDFLSGTSMATPIISGVVGLMLCNDNTLGPNDIEYCLGSTSTQYTSSINPGTLIHSVNVPLALGCGSPLLNQCAPSNCNLIGNGDLETPKYSNVTNYGGVSAISMGKVCSWLPTGTSDCLPFPINNVNNYAHIGNFFFFGSYSGWESLVSNPMHMIANHEYILEFDYAVIGSFDTTGAVSTNYDPLDSIIINLVESGFVWDSGNSDNLGLHQNLVNIYESPTDIILDTLTNTNADLLDGILHPDAYYHHYTLNFFAPLDTSINRLFIFPLDSINTRYLCLDNLSVRPVIQVQASANNVNITPGTCVNLTATGQGGQFIWEPFDDFANPIGANQNVCPDSTTTYIVTVFDSVTGCQSSDSITITVEDTSNVSLEKNTIDTNIKLYPNPAGNILFLEIGKTINERKIVVYDQRGKIVLTHLLNESHTQLIDVSSLNTGTYFLCVGKRESIEFVKK